MDRLFGVVGSDSVLRYHAHTTDRGFWAPAFGTIFFLFQRSKPRGLIFFICFKSGTKPFHGSGGGGKGRLEENEFPGPPPQSP